ncbi:MAG: uroporphyrinogen-III C-methyltransferase [Chloroflexota bacterium]
MNTGFVAIVGAGPGSADLITVRGLRHVRRAEVIIYDRLVDTGLLEQSRNMPELVFAGKERGRAALEQRSIELLMVDRARKGKYVVRLKGGDPFVFGRGGEEVAALTQAGVAHELVPGLSSALAVPASAGIPATHRDISSTITIVTGHQDPRSPDCGVDWDWLAQSSGTLVILMGLARLGDICTRLLAAGKEGATPAAVVASGARPSQRELFGSLATIDMQVQAAGLAAPAIIVIGQVAAFPAELVAAIHHAEAS